MQAGNEQGWVMTSSIVMRSAKSDHDQRNNGKRLKGTCPTMFRFGVWPYARNRRENVRRNHLGSPAKESQARLPPELLRMVHRNRKEAHIPAYPSPFGPNPLSARRCRGHRRFHPRNHPEFRRKRSWISLRHREALVKRVADTQRPQTISSTASRQLFCFDQVPCAF